MSFVRGYLPLLAASLIACSSASGEAGEGAAKVVSAKAEPARQQAEATQNEAAAQPAVIEIDVGTEAPDGKLVPIAPVAPQPRTLEWEPRASLDERLVFVPLTGGVVARASGQVFELDEQGALAANPKLELPEGELLGYWPDSVWNIQVEPMEAQPEDEGPRFYYRMATLSRGKWKIERRRGAERWRDGVVQFRKGWHGGLLLRKDTNITRIGSKRPKPRPNARKGRELVDMFESRAGRLYTVSTRSGGLYVQANCGDPQCIELNARLLPRGTSWSFSMHTPRRSLDGSMVASNEGSHYLLSYDKGASKAEDRAGSDWVLEPLPQLPAGMWPDAKGGLWLIVGAELWHRDRKGAWSSVELPGEASDGAELSAAMLSGQTELWLARASAGTTKVFATAGTPE